VRFSIEPLHDRELLQPIDVWVRRYETRLTAAALPVGDLLAAQWICANSATPEAANQGLWYFASCRASQIASSEVKLRRALTDDEYARALVERYVGNLGTLWLPGAARRSTIPASHGDDLTGLTAKLTPSGCARAKAVTPGRHKQGRRRAPDRRIQVRRNRVGDAHVRALITRF
jgi:hypothetical protein